MQGPAGTLGAGNLQGTQESNDQFGSCLAAGDFDGDGNADLAVGVPFDNVGSVTQAGAVNVIYGSATGLKAVGNQIWSQDSSGIPETAETNDRFGNALAVGDFNGDGKADLAIGVPTETIGSVVNAGAVNAIYGAAAGLHAAGAQIWMQGAAGIQGHRETGDRFGAALAAGDFKGVGRDALAIGAPGEDVYQSTKDEGVVQVLYSDTTSGLVSPGNQLWYEDVKGVKAHSKDGDQFGASLASGDFNNDTFDDLAIGVPFKDTSVVIDSGAIHILYGTATRISVTNNQFFAQGAGATEDDDHFGATLSVGDYNGDTFADVAVGAPLENQQATDDGAVNVFYGTGSGVTTTGMQYWHQGPASAGDVGENSDNFGASLASGDFDNDTFDDLSIGVPREDHSSMTDVGGMLTLYGDTPNGLGTAGKSTWDQDSPGIPGAKQIGSQWASALG
jgi:hypothetical protein